MTNYEIIYNKINYNENCFLESMIDVMIRYPLIWYDFVENILKNKLILVIENDCLIFSHKFFTKSISKTFSFIIERIRESGVIYKQVKNNDFIFVYTSSEVVKEFFMKSGIWLEYLVCYSIRNSLGLLSYRGVVFKDSEGNRNEIDCFLDYKGTLFMFECKDTYMYSEEDLKKIYNLKKKINSKVYIIFIITKLYESEEIDFKKYDIEVIKYNYNYFQLKELLNELIVRKIIEETPHI